MNKEQYEKDLRERQAEHLRQIGISKQQFWRPCMHDQCSECLGTGTKRDGSPCIHAISCPCPRCSPY